MGRWREFEVHVRGEMNNGVTPGEIAEILLQTEVYAGVPIAAEGFRSAVRISSSASVMPRYVCTIVLSVLGPRDRNRAAQRWTARCMSGMLCNVSIIALSFRGVDERHRGSAALC